MACTIPTQPPLQNGRKRGGGWGGKGGLLNVLENICLGKSEDFDFGGSALYGGGGGGNESIIWE